MIQLTLGRVLSPYALLAVGTFLTIVPAALSSEQQRERWGQRWAMDGTDYLLIGVSAFAIFVGLAVGMRRTRDGVRRPRTDPVMLRVPVDLLRRATSTLFVLYLFGYLVWVMAALRHGLTLSLVIDTFRGTPGATYSARATLATVPGVSTLTEVGPCLVAALAVLWRAGHRRRLMLVAVIALSTARSVVNSERLSVVEIVLPLAIVLAATARRRAATDDPVSTARRKRRATLCGALVAPLALLALFAVTERGRSWNSHYSQDYQGGLISFSLDRLTGYYASSTNNSALYYHYYAPHLAFPDLTLQAITRAPIIGDVLASLQRAPGSSTGNWLQFLAMNSNPEFNNPGTFLSIIGEIGVPSAVALFAVWGFLLGSVYRHLQDGSIRALAAYAAFAVGLLELPRYPYYTSGRAVPGLLALAVLSICLGRARDARKGIRHGRTRVARAAA